MREPVTHWVVAFKAEAQPIIDALEMKQVNTARGFTCFENSTHSHKLVISGIGKINAAAATAWLASESELWDSWLNLGIAGHKNATIGSTFRAGRITDAASGKSRYPIAVWPKKVDQFPVRELLTVDQPSKLYPETGQAIDMEAFGFFAAASRFSTSELIQSLKVVSDNETSDFTKLTPAKVEGMIETVVPDILRWLPAIQSLMLEEKQRLASPAGWKNVVSRFHFTETQSHQLKRLARRAIAMKKIDGLTEYCESANVTTGKQILKSLDDLLSDAEGTED